MYVGTFSDQKIINRLSVNDIDRSGFKKTDEEYKKMIDKGEIKDCLTFFFSDNISNAKKTAKEMGLKNFSKITKFYEFGKDY